MKSGPITSTTCPPEGADAPFEIVTACSEDGFVEIERVPATLNEDAAFNREVDRVRAIRAAHPTDWRATTVSLFHGDREIRQEEIA